MKRLKIETYGFYTTDFEKYSLATTPPMSYPCSKCGASVGNDCISPPTQYLFHRERIQATWDKLKSVAEFVTDTQIAESRVIKI